MADNLAKSFEDRLSFPDSKKANGTNVNASAFTPSSNFNWADEVSTPTQEEEPKADVVPEPTPSTAPPTTAPMSSLEQAQTDGAVPAAEVPPGEGLEEPEFDVKVVLADLQGDVNSPLYSVKTFTELQIREEILLGIVNMGFKKPSKIQERALPLLMKDPPTNFIGQSQSGTGKTAAFVLNILSRINLETQQPQALILAPTRELARQIAAVARKMGTFLADKGLTVAEAIPTPSNRGPIIGQIIVGTPGTVVDMLTRKRLDPRGIKVLTLDEADNMLDLQGMGDGCKRVKSRLPANVQVVLFSATFPQEVLEFASLFAPKANTITLEVQNLTVKGIKQMYLDCATNEEKYAALVKFYGLMTIASSIIFVQRRDTAAELERRMIAEGHTVSALSGALEGQERDDVLHRFRTGASKVLITTNVLARGIDVQTVTMVVNYDIPVTVDHKPDFETYLHRIGRTGRFGRTGAALSFVHDRKSYENLQAISQHFGVEVTKLETGDWDAVEKQLKTIMKNARNRAPPTTNEPVTTQSTVEAEMDD